jgi:hypothetical protein
MNSVCGVGNENPSRRWCLQGCGEIGQPQHKGELGVMPGHPLPAVDQGDGSLLQQQSVEGDDIGQRLHGQPFPPRDLVPGRQAVDVGGGGDHRLAAEQFGQLPGQLVAAAQVAGEQADGELPGLVQHHHRRVEGLAPQHRREQPHHDAGGHDTDQPPIAAEELGE